MKTFIKLPFRAKADSFYMVCILAYTSLLVQLLPLRFYYSKYLEGKGHHATADMQLYSEKIRLIKRVVKHVPWKVTCLMESLAFHIYFKQSGIEVPVTIGLKTGVNMKAHAWNFCQLDREFAVINK